MREDGRTLSFFDKGRWHGRLMDWAMRDSRFKTQLFRFVDVLPSLDAADAVLSHLREYFGDPRLQQARFLKPLLAVAGWAPPLTRWLVSRNAGAMARQFIAGATPEDALPTFQRLVDQGAGFTADILGETAVSEKEAEAYAARYLKLLEILAGRFGAAVNVSVKISALYSQIHPADPETAVARLKERLRPLLRRAHELGAFLNFDMESHALKDLTLALFKSLLDEPEFAEYGNLGIVIQAYLRESARDLDAFIDWAKTRPGRFTVRLVKGAYWDHETVVARQRNWPIPVFERKAATDANYERLSARMLENHGALHSAFGSHNVRSVAGAIVAAEERGVAPDRYEFQMLYGMAGPLERALLAMGHRVREYCPIGDLVPGMAYLVRRLLENTSNEGFLRAEFASGKSTDELLRDPRVEAAAPPAAGPQASGFRNTPLVDFTDAARRGRMRAALKAAHDGCGRRQPLVIGGREILTEDETMSVNPAHPAEIVGRVSKGSKEHAGQALDSARQALRAWRATGAEERAALLEKAGALMESRRFDLAALEVLEVGKNWQEADADVAEAIDFCNFYASEMRRLGPFLTDDIPGETNVHSYIPRGVGVVIAPWNFPLAILTGMTAAALVTGNCAIMKPAEQSPVIALRLLRILHEAGFPPGVVHFLPGIGEEIGEYLVEDPRVAFIAFTGSKEVGLQIYEAAGGVRPGQDDLKKVICEMGGKNAMIVDADADLDEAVAGAIASAFGYQGQKCSALSRLIVLEECYERFLPRLLEAAASLSIGPPEKPGTMIGPLIDADALHRVMDYIAAGKSEAALAFEGTPPDRPGYFCPPVIFTGVPPGARIAREEIFGPVLSVMKAVTFDEALALANDSEFALTGAVYSRSPAHIEKAKADFRVGNLYINRSQTGAMVRRQPFGGFKMSGGGTKAGGRDYLAHFMLPRVVTENVMRHGFAPGRE